MAIDIIFLFAIIIGAVKGMQRGFIIAVFSVIAIIIGLAAVIKLSSIAAVYLSNSFNIIGKWLPVVSFIIVFLGVVLLVRLAANFLQKTIELAYLGWLNRLAGALLYVLLYSIVLSVFLFFMEESSLLKNETIVDSKVYPWVEPLGPYVINGIGKVVPIFKDMFEELKAFFGNIPTQLPHK